MKIILQADVKGTGKEGQVCEVSDGYARNFLFPRKLAIEATAGNMQGVVHRKELEDKRKAKEKQGAEAMAEKLKGLTVEIATKTGEGGRLFGSVTNKEIAETLKKVYKIELDKRKLELKEPIKNLGAYTVHVKLHPEVSGELKVNVVSI